jgi:hypothetical protein
VYRMGMKPGGGTLQRVIPAVIPQFYTGLSTWELSDPALLWAPELPTGARVQVTNETRGGEILNAALASEGLSHEVTLAADGDIQPGDILRLRATYESAGGAIVPIEALATASPGAVQFFATPQLWVEYSAAGVARPLKWRRRCGTLPPPPRRGVRPQTSHRLGRWPRPPLQCRRAARPPRPGGGHRRGGVKPPAQPQQRGPFWPANPAPAWQAPCIRGRPGRRPQRARVPPPRPGARPEHPHRGRPPPAYRASGA